MNVQFEQLYRRDNAALDGIMHHDSPLENDHDLQVTQKGSKFLVYLRNVIYGMVVSGNKMNCLLN